VRACDATYKLKPGLVVLFDAGHIISPHVGEKDERAAELVKPLISNTLSQSRLSIQ